MDKPIDWRGSSLDDLRDFPETARKQAGYELRKLQRGEAPDDWRPFQEVGPGVNEIRINCPDGWFRVIAWDPRLRADSTAAAIGCNRVRKTPRRCVPFPRSPDRHRAGR